MAQRASRDPAKILTGVVGGDDDDTLTQILKRAKCRKTQGGTVPATQTKDMSMSAEARPLKRRNQHECNHERKETEHTDDSDHSAWAQELNAPRVACLMRANESSSTRKLRERDFMLMLTPKHGYSPVEDCQQ